MQVPIRILVLLSLVIPGYLVSLPLGPHIEEGAVDVKNGEGTLSLFCSDKTWINWETFSIGEGETVTFMQPSADSLAVNRIIGFSKSQIDGLLKAEGRLILINPQGVFIGPKGSVDVASLIASASDLISKKEDLFFTSRDTSRIVNEGNLVARNGQIVLLGREVINKGLIDCQGGFATLMGVNHVEIKATDFSSLFVPSNGIEDSYLQHSGQIVCRTVDGNQGGTVALIAKELSLISKSQIDVSAPYGGGTVLLGSDYQGKSSSFPNASITNIAQGAEIRADALMEGSGGKIIVWGNHATQMAGSLSAQGGPLGGDGGFLEVSSPGALNFIGTTNTLAPLGKVGTLLLDPLDLTISGAANSTVTGVSPFMPTGGACGAGNANLNTATLVGALGGGNVIVQTTGTVGVCPGNIFVTAPVIWATGNSLTLSAAGGVTVSADIYNTALAGGSITCTAANGDITIGNPASIVRLGAENGAVTVCALNGNITINSGNALGTGAGIGALNSTQATGTGDIQVSASQNITLNAGSGANSPAFIGHVDLVDTPLTINRNIDVTAGGNILLNASTTAADRSFAEIGYDYGGVHPSISATGNITVNAAGNLILTTGNNAVFNRAHIGRDGQNGITRINIALNVVGDLVLQSSVVPGFLTYIGFGIPQTNSASSIKALVAGNVYLDGRNSFLPACFIPTYTNGAIIPGYDPICSIRALGNIMFFPGVISHDTISLALNSYVTEVWAGGNFVCINSQTRVSTPAGTFTVPAPIQNISCRAAGDLIIGGSSTVPPTNLIQARGTGTYAGYSSTPFSGIFLESDSCFSPGEIWPGQTAAVCGSGNIFASNAVGSASPAIGCNQSGAVAFDLNAYNVNPPNFSYPFNGLQNLVPISTAAITGYTLQILSGTGNIIVHSADQFAGQAFAVAYTAGNPASLTIANPPGVSQVAIIQNTGFIEIAGSDGPSYHNCPCPNSFENITIASTPNPWTPNSIYVSANNNLTVNSAVVSSGVGSPITLIGDHDDSGLGSVTINANVTSANGPILIDAGFNGPLGGFSSIFVNSGTVSSGSGDMTLQALHDITIQGASPSLASTSGDIFMTASNDLSVFQPIVSTTGNITSLIGNNTLIDNTNITSAGTIELVTGDNMFLVGSTIESTGSSVTLVVDNDFPTAPLIGPGFFSMDDNSVVSSGPGIIRVFTAQQGLNSISPLAQFINGVTVFFFTPGTLFANTDREIWCTYFPSNLSGTPFTIFYKDCLQQLTEQAMIVVDEMLVDLHPYNEYPGWVSRYLIYFSEQLQEKKGYNLYEPYWITRRELKLCNHPKSWTRLLPEGGEQEIQR